MEWPCLRIGGALLPDLVKFYQWLHTDIAPLLTYDQASTMTIGKVIARVETNVKKEEGVLIRELYERVKKNYNEYVQLTGFTEPGAKSTLACNRNKRFTIADDIPILHFLTGLAHTLLATNYFLYPDMLLIFLEEEDHGNDWLYVVLADIISTHNYIIANVYSTRQKRKSLKQLLPEEPSTIFPTVVSMNDTIVNGLAYGHCNFGGQLPMIFF